MKRFIISMLFVIGLVTSASAHHNSPSDNAGGNMSDSSGHLELIFG